MVMVKMKMAMIDDGRHNSTCWLTMCEYCLYFLIEDVGDDDSFFARCSLLFTELMNDE